MGRWLKKEEEIQVHSLRVRKWLETEKGIAYKKRHKEYMKEWRKKNRQSKLEARKQSNKKIRLEVLSHYSDPPRCNCCGETEYLFLHIDHINGDGAKHRKLMSKEFGRKAGGNDLVYWLKKHDYPEGFQILCANCNLGKRLSKFCPHQIRGDQEN